jgi:cob(I)alamin adenosyltransferase
MKLYTKTGDAGETSLNGGRRVPKSSLRIDAYGTIDELNSHLGVVRALQPASEFDAILEQLQKTLFVLGTDLATPLDASAKKVERIEPRDIESVEGWIDRFDAQLEPLQFFIMPGGTVRAAHLHLARTVCRRAERVIDALGRQESIGSLPLIYVNRAADLLFVLARYDNMNSKVKDVPWRPSPGNS